jgi:hypothetical protein
MGASTGLIAEVEAKVSADEIKEGTNDAVAADKAAAPVMDEKTAAT